MRDSRNLLALPLSCLFSLLHLSTPHYHFYCVLCLVSFSLLAHSSLLSYRPGPFLQFMKHFCLFVDIFMTLLQSFASGEKRLKQLRWVEDQSTSGSLCTFFTFFTPAHSLTDENFSVMIYLMTRSNTKIDAMLIALLWLCSELGKHGGLGQRWSHVCLHLILCSSVSICVRLDHYARLEVVIGSGWRRRQLHEWLY